MLGDAKLSEGSYDKAVMWTGGGNEYEDVIRGLFRLDRSKTRLAEALLALLCPFFWS